MIARITDWKKNQAALLITLFFLAVLPYINTYHNQFTYDDAPILLEDHRLRSIQAIPALFTHDYFMTPDHNLYRPLPMFTMAVNYLLFGEAPWSYRVVNQVLHGLNVVILFIFLGNFYRQRPGLRFLASAVFALHPAATEAVNLIVYRAELFALGFSLAAFHLYLQRGKSRYALPGAAVLYFLAMLSKESAMILPLFLLLHHLYFERGRIRAFAGSMTGFVAAALLVAGMRFWALGAFGPQNIQQFFYGVPWTSTLFTMFKVIAYYWKIVVWPVALQMNYDFSDFPVVSSLFDARVLLSLAFLLSVLAAAGVTYRKNKQLSYFILWPFIALLPVMNILVPSGVLIAVRLLYLPMVGYSVVLATILLAPAGVPASRRSAIIAAGYCSLVLAVLFALTWDRNTDFRDTVTLFSRDLELSPRNTLSIKFLAPELPPDRAETLLLRALEASPTDMAVLSMLGEVHEKRGDHATAEALQKRSLALGSTHRAHKELGIVYSNTGRLAEAEKEFRKVIELKPYWSNAYEDLAIVMLKKGDPAAALAVAQKALSINPDSYSAYNLIGTCYKETGRPDLAAAAFEKAVSLSPAYFEALFNLADTYDKIDVSRAIRAWQAYIGAAENVETERPWVEEAQRRLASLSRAPAGGPAGSRRAGSRDQRR